MKCGYCFYCDIAENREQGSYGFMSEDTLRSVVRAALAHAEGSCVIAFQGGEPTLRGLGFFEKLIEYQNEFNAKGVKIENALQTNGLAIDDEFIGFLARNSFLTGISLDGSRDTHDKYRKTASGGETFFTVIETVNRFKKLGAEFNILTVVNGDTGKKANKIYSFYKKNGLRYMQFIACLDPLNEAPGLNAHSLTPEVYGKFLCELFDLWHEDLLKGTQPYIRQFENYIGILLGYGAESCDMRGSCGYQYVVEADGEVYPCDFYVLPEYKLGNLNEKSIAEIDARRREISFVEYSAAMRESCGACRYYAICRGGCRRHRLIKGENGNYLNYFCESYKTFFGHALERMLAVAEKIRIGKRG